MKSQKLLDRKSDILLDESNIFTILELQEARMLADIVSKVHNLQLPTIEVARESKIQRLEASLEKRHLRDHEGCNLRAHR